MSAVVIQQQDQPVRVPVWVSDLESFRRWATSDEFPDLGWYSWLDGELWVDPNMERVGHNLIKSKICAVLTMLVEEQECGTFLTDGMLLTHREAGLSTEPDGSFITTETLTSKRVILVQRENATEMVGSPDMVLEVVSRTSKQKDTVVLRDLYWRAGIEEYWLVDTHRDGTVVLEILRHTAKGYVATRRQGEWTRSAVFGRSFRLRSSVDAKTELPIYKLDVR